MAAVPILTGANNMKLREMLEPHLKGAYEIVALGFADYDRLYSEEVKVVHTPSCRAHIRNCHINARAAKYAALHSDEVQLFDSKGLQGILIKQVVAVLFKKLDDELKSRNNPTKQIVDYRAQREIPGIPAAIKLIAGYTEDEETGQLQGVFITRPSGHSNRWEMELKGDEAVTIATPLFAEEHEIEEVDILPRREPGEVIPLKRGQKDGGD